MCLTVTMQQADAPKQPKPRSKKTPTAANGKENKPKKISKALVTSPIPHRVKAPAPQLAPVVEQEESAWSQNLAAKLKQRDLLRKQQVCIVTK